MLFRGIPSGFLIAAMVWMIPSAETAKFAVITLMTYLIAVGGFTHIVAGSMEAYMLVLPATGNGGRCSASSWSPVLIGNIDRRHRAVRADFLRAGDGRNLKCLYALAVG